MKKTPPRFKSKCLCKTESKTQSKSKRRLPIHQCHEVSKDDIINACGILKKESELLCKETLCSYPTLDLAFEDNKPPMTLGDVLEILIPKKMYIWQNTMFPIKPINHVFDA